MGQGGSDFLVWIQNLLTHVLCIWIQMQTFFNSLQYSETTILKVYTTLAEIHFLLVDKST